MLRSFKRTSFKLEGERDHNLTEAHLVCLAFRIPYFCVFMPVFLGVDRLGEIKISCKS